MAAWDFLVSRTDLSRTEVRPSPVPDASTLAEGEALVEVERFSLTANNITYAVVGDLLGYWRFFPAPEGWGRIPAWGFGTVIASRADGVVVGTRLYGYWPMSTHLVARLRPEGSGFVDDAAHRAALSPVYNRYEVAPERTEDGYLALLRPLFTTSFLLDDYLAEAAPGATVILSSASSRTGIGLAWLLAQRQVPVVALTSDRNAAFVERLNLYSQVVLYEGTEVLEVGTATAFVDIAGDAQVRAAVHRRFHQQLILSTVVGGTHHEARGAGDERPPGPQPSFFFAPDRLAARRRDWGAAVLNERVKDALFRFIKESPWLALEHHRGPKALASLYRAILVGEAPPGRGDIVLTR